MTIKTTNENNVIAIRGAREHNLKGINVNIPRDRLQVLPGLKKIPHIYKKVLPAWESDYSLIWWWTGQNSDKTHL